MRGAVHDVLRLTAVAVLLLRADVSHGQCAGDCNGDGRVRVDELVAAVGSALGGCDAETAVPCAPRGIVTDPPRVLPSPDRATTLEGGVLQINDAVYQASGFGNTFLVVTAEGNVVIDTSLVLSAAAHRQALRAIDDGPIRAIILTHAHSDHTGGVGLWKEEGTEVIAQRSHAEFQHYQARLAPLFGYRNLAQFSRLFGLRELPPFAPPDAPVENAAGDILATIQFEHFYEFELGGLTFQMLHTPGETPDHLTVWIPEYKIAFPGDNYYISFPNLYTLRGTEPRRALDYVRSLDTVLGWEPEILAPSHGNPIYGKEEVRRTVTEYRDAIQYVHDETVRGMNAGKDVHTLMNEVQLPPDFRLNEVYGNVPWSVRGIYEGYIGWFDGNPSSMFSTPARSVYPALVEMAGGAAAVAQAAAELVEQGELQRALHMADVALAADAQNLAALRAKRDALERLLQSSVNLNEQGWLNAGIIEVDARLAAAGE
jgi:alkyl sulfatase BDS1-like metallo-beta-lactamase superfamily hydrolase